MHVSRIVVKNFRSLKHLDVPIQPGSSAIIGENSVGKSNLFHALRICLDGQLSSSYRSLLKDDIHCQVDLAAAFQVLIGVEFSGFQGNENQEALLHGTEIEENRARLFYRFRPKRIVREELAREEFRRPLTLEDYSWELAGGGTLPWTLQILNGLTSCRNWVLLASTCNISNPIWSYSCLHYVMLCAPFKEGGAALDEAGVPSRRQAETASICFLPRGDHYGTGNLLNRDFTALAPNEKWLTDISEFQIPAGKVYLSPMIDCFDGKVIGRSERVPMPSL